jgi:hypothetical protein
VQKYYDNLTVLVATKDRPAQIINLLESLSDSSMLPRQVIVVYNGINVTNNIEVYESKFDLRIIYSNIASQVYQKKIGLTLLSDDCDWVLFLDDDIVIELDSIEILFENYVRNDKYSEYAGFGLAIRNRKYRKLNILVKVLLFAAKLFSFKPGALTKGGHPQAYLDHKESRRVEWLNGISIWRRSEVNKYSEITNVAEYSAYEDVMFSYKVSQNQKLFFASDAFVQDQVEEDEIPLTCKQLIAATYARYNFVRLHPEFSIFWLLVGQVIRNIDFIFRSKSQGTIVDRIKLTSSICIKLFLIIFRNKDPNDLLK